MCMFVYLLLALHNPRITDARVPPSPFSFIQTGVKYNIFLQAWRDSR